MNAKMGKPQGTTGTVTFDGAMGSKPAVRDASGRVWVQSVNPNLWLPCDVRPEQFVAGE